MIIIIESSKSEASVDFVWNLETISENKMRENAVSTFVGGYFSISRNLYTSTFQKIYDLIRKLSFAVEFTAFSKDSANKLIIYSSYSAIFSIGNIPKHRLHSNSLWLQQKTPHKTELKNPSLRMHMRRRHTHSKWFYILAYSKHVQLHSFQDRICCDSI